ncbi:MAG: hypothetical protein IPN14_00200 [Bacteroidetes bacterium]|nr:hypothetical protein [Bacteroidota bacterium]
MGFFKNLFNDIKLSITPLGNYKSKINEYINFISAHSFGPPKISEETAEKKLLP